MSALVIGLDQSCDAKLRPAWLRPAALACVIMAHGLLLFAVWPKDIDQPPETNIEISVVPQQMAAEPASMPSADSLPQHSPNESVPVDTRSVVDPIASNEETKPAEIKSAEPALPSETLPQPVQIGLAAPAPPPVATEQLPPAAPSVTPQTAAPQTPPLVQTDQGTLPVGSTPPPPPVSKARDDETQRLAAERRKQLLQRENEAAKRLAAEKERQAAEDAKRQAEARQRAAQRAARPASLPPAQSPVAGGGQIRSPSSPAVSPAAIGAFRGQVMGHLAGYKHYPESARARGAEGRPTVAFSLDASGHVTSVSLSHSSGQPDIDAEVVAMVRRASPFPAPPPGASRSFSATIGFVLH